MSFAVSADNPMGRQHIMKGVAMHNKLIIETAPYIDSHQDRKLIAFKELRAQRPNWMPTPYEAQIGSIQQEIMDNLIKNSRSCIDSSPPALAWHHHTLQNVIRRVKLQDPMYWKTQGHKIQWSFAEQDKARSAFEVMEKAKSCNQCSISNKLSEGTERYLEWKRQEAGKKLPPIDVPLHPASKVDHAATKQRALQSQKDTLEPKIYAGSPLARGDLTWNSAEGSSALRALSLGVPDNAPDNLKVASTRSPVKKSSSKGLPPELVSRTVKHSWNSASNRIVRNRFLARQTGNDPSDGISTRTVNLAQEVVHGSTSPMDRPVEHQLMYRAEVVMPCLATKPDDLTVHKGDLVFIMEDASEGMFKLVDAEGKLGKVPSNAVKFLEPCPAGRLQPARNGLGGSPVRGKGATQEALTATQSVATKRSGRMSAMSPTPGNSMHGTQQMSTPKREN